MIAHPTPPTTETAPPVGMSLEDYLNIPLERFELINGEIVPKMPNFPRHDNIGNMLRDTIQDAMRGKDIGFVTREWTFVLLGTARKNWVTGSYIPDIMFIRQARFDAYIAERPNWLDEPFELVPDLVIEIVSVNDQNKDIREKVNRYLNDGVPFVWVVDPRYRRVTIYRAEGDPTTVLTDADTLDGGDLIPGFSIAVAALFA